MKTFGYRSAVLLTTILLSVGCVAAQTDQSPKIKIDQTIARLSALAGEAQTFDPPLRSRIQTQVASLLWKFDKVFARDLFLKAWEAAEATDREAGEKQQDGNSSSSNTTDSREARREVISAAWRRDPALGQELLAKMTKRDEEAQRDNESDNSSSAGVQINKLSSAELERLNVAAQLLRNGEPTEAAKFAGDVLNRAVIPSLRFLSNLREKNADAADELYVSLLTQIAADPAADANTISILSSYIFSPYLYVTITGNGSPRIVQNSGDTYPANVPARIRSMFLDVAAQVLLRPTLDPAAQRTSYLISIRLLPLFERFNPNLAAQIKTRINEISTSIPPGLKNSEVVSKVRSGITNPDVNENLRDILDRAKQLPNGTVRNQLYIRAAILAAGLGDRRATQIVEEIDPPDLRDRVRGYVSMLLAKHALAKKDVEAVLEFARSESLSQVERVWLYTKAIELMNPKSRRNVLDVLMQVVAIARRMDSADADKARALTAVALQFMRYNRRVAGPYLFEAVTASKAETFDPDNGVLEVRLETPAGDWTTFYDAPGFRLTNLFRELAKEDFLQALNMSENLKSKAARSLAIVAIAETVLTSTNVPAP